MTIDEIRENVRLRLGKSNLGGYLHPDRFNVAVQKATLEEFNDLYKEYEKSQKISDDLRQLVITDETYRTVDSNRYVDLPADYQHLSSARGYKLTNVEGSCTPSEDSRPIEILTDDQFNYREYDALAGPSFKHPIATIQNDKLKVLPSAVGFVKITYLRKPATPYFDYNIAAGGPVYLPSGSTHDGTNQALGTASRTVEVEFPHNVCIRIANRTFALLSEVNKNQLGLQVSKQEIANG